MNHLMKYFLFVILLCLADCTGKWIPLNKKVHSLMWQMK